MSFATTDDVATRLGADLSTAEVGMAEALLEAATAIIAEAAGEDDDWAAALSPVPTLLKVVAVEVVCRAMANPAAARSLSEQIGSYQYSQSFKDDGGGLWLTDNERALVRRAVNAPTSGSARQESIVHEIAEEIGWPYDSSGLASLTEPDGTDPVDYLP